MRIADSSMRNNMLRNLHRTMRDLTKMQKQLASGQLVSKPSDNPVAATRLHNLNTTLAEVNQFARNVTDGQAYLNATDVSLDLMGETIQRARQLALSGVTDTVPNDAKAYIAREVDQAIQHMVALANTSLDGDRFIFAGIYGGGQPYTMELDAEGFVVQVSPTDPVMAGKGLQQYEIMRGTTMQVNTEGEKLFIDGRIFEDLIYLRDTLLKKEGTDGDEAIKKIDDMLNVVLEERSRVGARQNRLDITDRRYEDEIFAMTELKSKVGDIDMAEAIMNYNVREQIYHAALSASARVMQPSLLDFMR